MALLDKQRHYDEAALLEAGLLSVEEDFELWLVNVKHGKKLSGRKTDVQDA